MVTGKYRMELAELVKMGARARLRAAAPDMLAALVSFWIVSRGVERPCLRHASMTAITSAANLTRTGPTMPGSASPTRAARSSTIWTRRPSPNKFTIPPLTASIL